MFVQDADMMFVDFLDLVERKTCPIGLAPFHSTTSILHQQAHTLERR
jgi:hypothetical protein